MAQIEQSDKGGKKKRRPEEDVYPRRLHTDGGHEHASSRSSCSVLR